MGDENPKTFQMLSIYLQVGLLGAMPAHGIENQLNFPLIPSCLERPVPAQESQPQETQLEQVSILASLLMLQES